MSEFRTKRTLNRGQSDINLKASTEKCDVMSGWVFKIENIHQYLVEESEEL